MVLWYKGIFLVFLCDISDVSYREKRRTLWPVSRRVKSAETLVVFPNLWVWVGTVYVEGEMKKDVPAFVEIVIYTITLIYCFLILNRSQIVSTLITNPFKLFKHEALNIFKSCWRAFLSHIKVIIIVNQCGINYSTTTYKQHITFNM